MKTAGIRQERRRRDRRRRLETD